MSARAKFTYTRRTLDDFERAKRNIGGGNRETFVQEEFSSRIWKRRDGDNTVRILPPAPSFAGEYGHYGVPVYRHFNVGPDNSVVLCPWKMRQEHCVICDAFNEARENEDQEMMRSFRASAATMVWMLDQLETSAEKQIPMLWFIPISLDLEILEQSRVKKDNTILPIDDPFEGYDISFTFDPKAKGSKMYSGVQIDRQASMAAETEDKTGELLEFIMENPLPDLLIHHSPEHIEHIFSGGTASSSTSTGPEKEPEVEVDVKVPVSRRRRAAPKEESVEVEDIETDQSDEPPFETKEEAEAEDKAPPTRRRRPAVSTSDNVESPAERRKRLAARYKS